jgi:outer membrane protein assembly factor BamB
VRFRVVLVLAVASMLTTAGCDWTMFRFGAAHTGYNTVENKIGTANVSELTARWIAATGGVVESSPAVAKGVAYVGSADGKLYAFDAAGATNCSGVPTTCAPLWTATTGSTVISSPAVVSGVVYVGSADGKLYAFDAAGVANCSGTPTSCAPLWRATTGGAVQSSPAVANGVVYVGSNDGKLYAFDAAGVANCSGTPTSCAPLWRATTGGAVRSSPAVANGVVYVGSNDGKLYAFDAAGAANCSGTPTSCAPLWTATTGGELGMSSPAVANGVVYVGSQDGKVYALDAAGSTNCSGTPTSCSPLWTADTGGGAEFSSPAVANGVVYAGSGNNLYAFDATGSANCSGAPKSCAPLWMAATGNDVDSPTVTNGVVYIGSADHDLYAFTVCGSRVASVGFAPCDIQNAYRLPSGISGSGKTVAIVDAHHDPNAAADLAVYRSMFGLPPCTKANGCFRQVNELGQSSNYPSADAGWAVEISLDIEMVSAACPNCDILLVEGNNTLGDLATAEDTAAALGANVISNSYGTLESSAFASLDSHFSHTGIPSVVASGDGGYAAGPQWPAVIPTATAVGGTTLTQTGTGRGWSEQVWNDGTNSSAGSGCSTFEPKPSWQHDTGCAHRAVSDVAAVAKNLAIYDTYQEPGWLRVGGTSAAAPIIASVDALGGDTAGPSDIYANANTLFDVTSGNNGSCNGSYLCTATTGYDGPTGLGTPCGVSAFGGSIASPAGCGGSASSGLSVAPNLAPLANYVPACRTAPPDGVRCLAYIAPVQP